MAHSLSGDIADTIVDIWQSENSEDADFSIESIDDLRDEKLSRPVDRVFQATSVPAC